MYISYVFLLPHLASVINAWPLNTVLKDLISLEQRALSPRATYPDSGSWGPVISTAGTNCDWMKKISDATPLTTVSIPGTHDTMTGSLLPQTNVDSNPFKTQIATLDDMFKAGLRFIDIRCHQVNDQFQIWHTIANTGKTFTDVLNSIQTFLAAHPSETVIMRVHNENDYTGDSKTNKKTFGEVYAWYKSTNAATKNIFATYQYNGPFTSWPTMGQARGKFLVLVDFNAAPSSVSAFGYQYANSNNLLDIEDNYQISKSVQMEKYGAITAHLDKVRAVTDTTKMYITYCSGTAADERYFLVFTPYKVAIHGSGSIIGGIPAWNGTNRLVYTDYLPNHTTGRLGVVIFDFPGQDLINKVITRN